MKPIPFVLFFEFYRCAKTVHLTTQNTVPNIEFLRFGRGKFYLARWNMKTSQSFSNCFLARVAGLIYLQSIAIKFVESRTAIIEWPK